MKKKVGTFKIWLLAIAAVVAFSVLPKVSSLATEDQALVVKENKQETVDAAGDESSAGNKQETAGEGANLEAQKDVHQMLGSLCVYLIKVLCMQALRCAGCMHYIVELMRGEFFL